MHDGKGWILMKGRSKEMGEIREQSFHVTFMKIYHTINFLLANHAV
jgi:hypothetical protein